MKTKALAIRILWMSALALLLGACSTMQSLHILEYTVNVVDQNGHPIKSALVETSDGDKVATGADGNAKLKFGAVGVYSISVTAEGLAPAAFSINMPLDVGKSKTVRLVPPATPGMASGAAMMASAMMAQQLYPIIFQSLFSNYGYRIDVSNYQPGQWTAWEMRGDEGSEPMKLRKAYLKKVKEGEWWQVETFDKDKKQPTMIMEVLFSTDLKSIRRMRQKMGDGEASEVPVSEGWYTAPQNLTHESMEGAVAKRGVSVKVPAGTFTADLLRFAHMGAATLQLWRSTKVPGGVVKSETLVDGEGKAEMVLTAYGSGAKTALKSY